MDRKFPHRATAIYEGSASSIKELVPTLMPEALGTRWIYPCGAVRVTGTGYRHGTEFMEKGMKVKLVKEPGNEFDSEAIAVKMEGLDEVGYVANSVRTRKGESMSAGRLYDKIGDEAEGTILYIFPDGVLCVLDE